MIKYCMRLFAIFVMIMIVGCGIMRPKWKSVALSPDDLQTANLLGIRQDQLKKLIASPLYQFSPAELDQYLGYLQYIEPDLRKRVQHLARKCLGQPYQIYLLGEFPYEIYDPDPLFSLQKSDCVVFSEHIYAMALSYDWKSFFAMLQRIRYKNGEIGIATRNHYTEFDWIVNNNWLLEDITELLGDEQTRYETTAVNRAGFLSKYGIGQMIPVDTVSWSYLPYQLLLQIVDKLLPGDFVNIVRGYDDNKWVGHVGLVTVDENGTRNFLHSTAPRVKEQPLLELLESADQYNAERREFNQKVFLENKKIIEHNQKLKAKYLENYEAKKKPLKKTKPYFYGFKFLRLKNDPIWELMKIDGPDVPKIYTAPVFY
ncbi:MAG TPA: DUF1460 domain-containing protein [bacterium]|nr:DUF1460 domain-containing protein [bacterium]